VRPTKSKGIASRRLAPRLRLLVNFGDLLGIEFQEEINKEGVVIKMNGSADFTKTLSRLYDFLTVLAVS
jgi:hypothetical protein